MTRLRVITLLLAAGLFVTIAGSTAMADTTGESTPSTDVPTVQEGDDGRHCC